MIKLAFYSSWVVYILLIFICFYWHINNIRCKLYIHIIFGAFTLLGTLAFITADYPSYMEIVDEAVFYKEYYFTHIEPFYVWLANILRGNYLLFRFSIMCSTFILLYQLYKRIDACNFSVLFFYTVFCLHTNISGRQALANLLFLLGAWQLYIAGFRIHKLLFPIICVVGSLFLHKSSILFLPLLLVFHLKIGKKFFLFVTLFFLLLLWKANYLMEIVLNISYEYGVAGRNYLIAEARFSDRNIWWIILTKMQDVAVISILIIEIIFLSKHHQNSSLTFVYRMISWSFCIALLCLLFPIESDVIFRRVLAFIKVLMVIPLPILCYYIPIRKCIMLLTCIYFIATNIFILGVSHSFFKTNQLF